MGEAVKICRWTELQNPPVTLINFSQAKTDIPFRQIYRENPLQMALVTVEFRVRHCNGPAGLLPGLILLWAGLNGLGNRV